MHFPPVITKLWLLLTEMSLGYFFFKQHTFFPLRCVCTESFNYWGKTLAVTTNYFWGHLYHLLSIRWPLSVVTLPKDFAGRQTAQTTSRLLMVSIQALSVLNLRPDFCIAVSLWLFILSCACCLVRLRKI